MKYSLGGEERWVAHMLRLVARDLGWMSKRTGIESVFDDRKGVLDILTGAFTGEHLILRSWPDMILRSRRGTFPVEAKALLASSALETGNASLELYQYLLLLALADFDACVWYCFGAARTPTAHHRSLAGWMVRAADLKPHRVDVPQRVRLQWPESLQRALDARIRALGVPCRETPTPKTGSGDPYILVSLNQIRAGVPIRAWLEDHLGSAATPKEQRAWEGEKEMHQRWGPLPPPPGILRVEDLP